MSSGASRRTLAAGLLAAVLTLVCGCASGPATPSPVTAPAPTAAPAPASPAAPAGSDDRGGGTEGGDDRGQRGRAGGRGSDDGGGGGGNGTATAAATLPADFPADVPLPPGDLQAASGAVGQWSVLLRVPGSAADALRSAMQFYAASGFTSDSPSTAHRGGRTVTLAAENRDHSPTSTNLAVGITDR